MTRLALSSLVTLSAVLLAGSSAAAPRSIPTLTAIVGTNDRFEITLNGPDGIRLNRLLPGTYTVIVDDRSAIHNFHLASEADPTVDFKTGVEFVGQKTFTVTFLDQARYAYACEPHWQTMNGQFFVQSAPPPALAATVTRTGKVRLSRTTVAAGRYRITVHDRTARDNFHLRGPGVNRRTGKRAQGAWT